MMSGSFEFEQAQMLAQNNKLEVSYLAASLHPTKTIKNSGFQKWSEDKVSVYTYSRFFLPRIYPLYFLKLRNVFWVNFLKMVEQESGLPDVIHLHYPTMMLLADVLSYYKEKGVRIVVTEHWSKVLTGKNDAIEKKQLRKYIHVVDKFLCVGEPLKKAVAEIVGSDEKLMVVPNVVNSLFVPNNLSHSGFEFIAVGRLVKHKQFDKIINVFIHAFIDESDVTLTVIGGGGEKENLQKIVAENKADKKIKLLGSLSREETAEKVSNADCLVCFSSFETFGVPIIESWACGKPTISTTACGVINPVEEQLGIEIEPDDILGLEKAMKYIYEHKETYSREYISTFATNHFSKDVISDILLRIYSET